MKFDNSYFENEIREGFFIPGLTKRSWAAQMDVLETINTICEKHHLTWFAMWGTLLGAVRHRGFIPWDDDIDIAMMRADYESFLKIAQSELPDDFVIYHFDTYRDHTNYLTRIVGSSVISSSIDFLKAHHGFPYIAGIDIFPLDYLAPDEKHMNLQHVKLEYVQTMIETISANKQEQSDEELIANVERLCGVPVNRELPLENALYRVNEQIFQDYNNVKSDFVSMMTFWYKNTAYKFSARSFDHILKLPFETMEVNVPSGYEEILTVQFGSWRTPIRAIGDYEYPFYAPDERSFAEHNNGKAAYKYYIAPDDLKNDERQTMALKADSNRIRFQQISDFHDSLCNALREKDSATGLHILEKCQEMAIQIGTDLEETQGESHPTVKLLEEYCEQVYQIYERISCDGKIEIEKECESLTSFLHTVQLSYAQNRKKDILFFPFKSAYWHTMQPLYEAAMSSANCNVHVIPLPVYEKNINGTIGKEHFDKASYPKDLPLLDYYEYDYERRHPDIMVIQNPYDEYGSATSIHPFFYSKNLKKYTEQLIYVPYFTLDEIDPDDKKSLINAPCYAVTPGVVHADRVIVQSENMKQVYVNALTEAAGENTRQLWEDKLSSVFPISILCPDNELGKKNIENQGEII